MIEHMLTRLEVQKILRVSKSKMFKLIRTGEIPVIQVGNTYLIRETELIKYLDDQKISIRQELNK